MRNSRIYLYTNLSKSKDIDIVVGLRTLSYLREKYEVKKNVHLKKYEIVEGEFDIDIYVPYFSRLVIPSEDLLKMEKIVIKGIPTVPPEALLTLKLDAWKSRGGSVKGDKDAIDIVTLIIYTQIDWVSFLKLVKKYNRGDLLEYLKRLVKEFENIEYIGMDFRKFHMWKREFLKKLKLRS